MKPFINCPNCNGVLKNVIQNAIWHEKYCADRRCELEYHQYFDGDFDSDKLLYMSFHTPNFHIYVYFENGYFPNISHIYSYVEMTRKEVAGPVMKLETKKVMEIIKDMSREQILKFDTKL